MFPFIGQPEPLGFVSSDRQHTETLSETLTGFQYTTIHTYHASKFTQGLKPSHSDMKTQECCTL